MRPNTKQTIGKETDFSTQADERSKIEISWLIACWGKSSPTGLSHLNEIAVFKMFVKEKGRKP